MKILSTFLLLLLVACNNSEVSLTKEDTVALTNKEVFNKRNIRIVHDTIAVHDTIYKFKTSKDNFHRINLFCVDENEGLVNGNIYTAIDKIITDDGIACYYVDGVGLRRASRFLKIEK